MLGRTRHRTTDTHMPAGMTPFAEEDIHTSCLDVHTVCGQDALAGKQSLLDDRVGFLHCQLWHSPDLRVPRTWG